jgi:TPP-dependent pyruvate/acetoin dehydrogenase alpha subunit
MHSVLTAEGDLRSEAPLGLSESTAALRLMVLARSLDRRLIGLSRRDVIGTYSPLEGQEASVLGSALALDRSRDWLVPSYREQAALLQHGLPLNALLAVYFGKMDAARIPDGVRIFTRQQAIGTQLPQAVGLAWGLKLRKEDSVVIVYFGEGASSEGDFHEACNLAGVVRAPIVFFLQNNGWAISTPASRQTAATSFAARAAGYGFSGTVVDGNDLFAVYEATKDAVERARSGEGPTLIESRTYRLSMHNTADNPRRYRAETEVEAAGRTDPIERLRRYLTARRALDDETFATLERDVAAELDEAIAWVQALPRPDRSAVFAHLFAELPPALQRQRDR